MTGMKHIGARTGVGRTHALMSVICLSTVSEIQSAKIAVFSPTLLCLTAVRDCLDPGAGLL